jgi:hypothetical protein
MNVPKDRTNHESQDTNANADASEEREARTMSESTPLSDPVEEGYRVIEAAKEADLTVKLMGGTAIRHHAETAREEPFEREYRDVDFVGTREDKNEIIDLMLDLGYEEKPEVNRMHRFRLEFYDQKNERKADYVIDRFEFCHAWSLRGRIEEDDPTIPIEDLLLSKLQIVEISERDIRDIVAMVTDHPIETGDDTERIDPEYVSGLCSDDWGLCRTVTMNLDRVETHVENNEFPIDETTIHEQVDALRSAIEEEPKSIGWKLRSVIGERKQWYDEPELT